MDTAKGAVYYVETKEQNAEFQQKIKEMAADMKSKLRSFDESQQPKRTMDSTQEDQRDDRIMVVEYPDYSTVLREKAAAWVDMGVDETGQATLSIIPSEEVKPAHVTAILGGGSRGGISVSSSPIEFAEKSMVDGQPIGREFSLIRDA